MIDLTDFAVQERPEGNLMVAISRPWYNGSYTMAAKPIKSLELHYTMIQFLIIGIIPQFDHVIPFLVKSHRLPVKFRIDFKILLLVLKALQGKAPMFITRVY